MGQKVNPKIFRLGIFNKDWKLKYIENKISESSSVLFKALQIKEYLKKILRFHGLRLRDYTINLSNSSVRIKASYTVTEFSTHVLDKNKKDLTIFTEKNSFQLQKYLILYFINFQKKFIEHIDATDINNIKITELKFKKLSMLLISLVNKKSLINLILLLLIALKKKEISKKKYKLIFLKKKYKLIFLKNKLGFYFTLHYLLKIRKKLQKRLRKFFCTIRRIYLRGRKTDIRKKDNAKYLSTFIVYSVNEALKILLITGPKKNSIKKLFLLISSFKLNKSFKKNFINKDNKRHLVKKLIKNKFSNDRNFYFITKKKKSAKKALFTRYNYKFRRLKKKKRYQYPKLKRNGTTNNKKPKPLKLRTRIKKALIKDSEQAKLKKKKHKRKSRIKIKIKDRLINLAKTKYLFSIYNMLVLEYSNKNDKKGYNLMDLITENLRKIFNKKKFCAIHLTFQHLTLTSNLLELGFKKTNEFIKNQLFELKKYHKNNYFEESIQNILIMLTEDCSAQFLADYIASKLPRLVKKQRFFLRFIKKVLELFMTVNFSKVHGVKITFRGRTDKKRRKQRNHMKIGKINLQSITSNISHAFATSKTADGSIGTEVWVNYKKIVYKIKNVFTTKKI